MARQILQLDGNGHSLVRWPASSDTDMKMLVAERLLRGYTFFRLEPHHDSVDPAVLAEIRDYLREQPALYDVDIGDPAIYKLSRAGKLTVSFGDAATLTPTDDSDAALRLGDRLTTPDEIVAADTLVIRPMTGG